MAFIPIGTNIEYIEPSPKPWVYGVDGLLESSPQLTRTDDAVGKSWRWQGAAYSSVIETDFDSTFNFERVTDSYGNEFVRIPKIYRKVVVRDGEMSGIKISNTKLDSTYKPYPCFVNASTGLELDYTDVGAYKASGSDRMESKSDVAFTGNKTIDNFRTMARANTESGYIYHQHDIWIMQLLCDLQMVVFATRQCEDYMGTTWKSYDGGINCGDTDTLVNNNLDVPINCCAKKTGKGGFKFFGIEDYCGYAFEYADGIRFSYQGIYVQYEPSSYSNGTSGKIRISYSRNRLEGYIREMGYDANNPFVNYPIATSGSESTYYPDYVHYETSYSGPGEVSNVGACKWGSLNQGLFYRRDFGRETNYASNESSRLCRKIGG